MSGVLAALKGGAGFRLTEENLISILGKKYWDPARSPIKMFWDIGIGVPSR